MATVKMIYLLWLYIENWFVIIVYKFHSVRSLLYKSKLFCRIFLKSPRISLTVIPDKSASGGRDPGSSKLSLSQNYSPQAGLADFGMYKSRFQEKANIQKN